MSPVGFEPTTVQPQTALQLRSAHETKGNVMSDLSRTVHVYIYIYIFFFIRGLSPRANYKDRATAACRRIYCQLLRIEGATWSA
jgi:hypothetical protein